MRDRCFNLYTIHGGGESEKSGRLFATIFSMACPNHPTDGCHMKCTTWGITKYSPVFLVYVCKVPIWLECLLWRIWHIPLHDTYEECSVDSSRISLHWRHNGHNSVSNYKPYDCLLNRLFRRRSNIRKHQSSASLAFVRGNHRRPVNSPHIWPVTRKVFPFDDVIMIYLINIPFASTTYRAKYSHCLQSGY